MKNLYALPEYDNLFILGTHPTTPSPASSSPVTVYKAMLKQTKVEAKNVAFNIGGPLSSIDGSYIRSPVIVRRSYGPKHKDQQKSNETIINSAAGAPSRPGSDNY